MDKQELLSTLRNHINKEKEKRENADSDTWISGYGMGRVDALTLGYEKVEQLDEPEKPEIPKFVADWIEEVKQRGCGLADALNCFVSPIMPEKVKQWIQFDFAVIGCHHDNQELLAKAWLNGYTIEKEPAWVVRINEKLYFCRFTDKYFEENPDKPTYSESGNPELVKKFTDKAKAEAVATLIEGTVEDWSE